MHPAAGNFIGGQGQIQGPGAQIRPADPNLDQVGEWLPSGIDNGSCFQGGEKIGQLFQLCLGLGRRLGRQADRGKDIAAGGVQHLPLLAGVTLDPVQHRAFFHQQELDRRPALLGKPLQSRKHLLIHPLGGVQQIESRGMGPVAADSCRRKGARRGQVIGGLGKLGKFCIGRQPIEIMRKIWLCVTLIPGSGWLFHKKISVPIRISWRYV